MKKILLLLSVIVTCAFAAQAKLNVVATLPDFGSLAREIGGDKINLIVLAKPTEDPHFVDARPSFVVSLRNADVLIDGGAELGRSVRGRRLLAALDVLREVEVRLRVVALAAAMAGRTTTVKVKMKKAEGALVAEPQSNGPAAKAGIQSGDVITSVNGTAMRLVAVKPGKVLISLTSTPASPSMKKSPFSSPTTPARCSPG